MAKTFFFHGHAVGLGGIITRPFQRPLESKAAATLPISGGSSSNNSGSHVFPDPTDPALAGQPKVVSIKSADTELSGQLDTNTGVYRTTVTTTVTGLNVRDIVTADTVVANIVSEHYPGEDEPRITFAGSKIDNLQINGTAVAVEMNDVLFGELNSFTRFKDKFDSDSNFRTQVRRQFLWGELQPNEIPDFFQEQYRFTSTQKSVPESKGIVPCSAVKNVNINGSSGFQMFRHILVIPDFGKLFLGELLLERQARRLTMMRFELGSPVAGSLTVAGGEGNGSTYP